MKVQAHYYSQFNRKGLT